MRTNLQSLLLVLAGFASLHQAAAQGTAFTYQGQLQNNGSPASGIYNLTFSLFNTNATGSAIAGPVTNNGVLATNGLFTTIVDFGGGVFGGTTNWLEIAVQTNGGGNFATLAPRQQITPTPYAIYSANAGSAATASSIAATNLTGMVTLAQLPVAVVTNSQGGVTLSGTFNGNASGLTNLNAASLAGTVTSLSAANVMVTSNLFLPATTTNAGVIYQGVSTLIHSYGTSNFFSGLGAGNLTMTGVGNVAVGVESLSNNATGSDNTACGWAALRLNTSGHGNTASGQFALQNNTTGFQNTADGASALLSNTSGFANSGLGINALYSNTTGSHNTTGGWDSLYLNSGNDNIAFGFESGFNLTGGSSNIDIGNLGVAGESGTMRIGTQGIQTSTVIAGIFGGTAASGVPVYVTSSGMLGTLTSSARFKQNIHNMDDASDVLLSLRPVTFQYKPQIDPQGIPQFGLVAEEVDQVDPDLVARDEKNRIYTVRYEAVNAMLLNEFQKEHRIVEEQNHELQDLKRNVAELKQLVQSLAAKK